MIDETGLQHFSLDLNEEIFLWANQEINFKIAQIIKFSTLAGTKYMTTFTKSALVAIRFLLSASLRYLYNKYYVVYFHIIMWLDVNVGLMA
jgi:hypothetical protein